MPNHSEINRARLTHAHKLAIPNWYSVSRPYRGLIWTGINHGTMLITQHPKDILPVIFQVYFYLCHDCLLIYKPFQGAQYFLVFKHQVRVPFRAIPTLVQVTILII